MKTAIIQAYSFMLRAPYPRYLSSMSGLQRRSSGTGEGNIYFIYGNERTYPVYYPDQQTQNIYTNNNNNYYNNILCIVSTQYG